tara:strand:- start:29627 stop:30049 length:423 start_codon:yes stop_codon:yes gene_type:complete
MMAGLALLALSAQGWSKGYGGGDRDPQRMLQHMTAKLSLDDAQRQQVQTLLQEKRQGSTPERERMRELKQELHAMRGNLDTDKARALTDELGDLTAQRALEMTQLQAGIYEILTPEQREQMEEMKAEREQRRANRDKHGR